MQEINAQPQPITRESKKSRRGFASMDKERHKLASSKGGHSSRGKTTKNRTPNESGRDAFL